MIRRSLQLLVLFCVLRPAGGQAQTARESPGWNSPRALELLGRAQQRRQEANSDTGLVNYRAQARAYVYFYLDRFDTNERNLVKTDQLALEVFWQAPDLAKQRIIGWRGQKSLPTNINYHLDHLSVVQENFGDEIRLGDGDEVRGVMHPAAPRAEEFYHYRLADSLTLRLPGAPEPVRVYELEVRPVNPEQPAFLGSIYVDMRQGDLVRMDFTFTSAAYVDRYLDYINISLDNGLWRGRFWLPNQQRVEIRRHIRELDIPAGSVIRATMRISDYELNLPLNASVFMGPPVVALPRAARESFEFEQDIHAEVLAEGIGPEIELTEIRRLAAALVRQRVLNRTPGLRLRIPRASETLRYNRAEGLAVNLGPSFALGPSWRLGALGGWAFGADHPLGRIDLSGNAAGGTLHATLYANRPRDIGVGPVASGALNTLASLFAAEDYTDVYFTDGAEVTFQRSASPGWRVVAGARAERHDPAEQEDRFSVFGGEFRPVRPIDQADLFVGGRLAVERVAPSGLARWWSGVLSGEAGSRNPGRGSACPASGGPDCQIRASFFKPAASLEAGHRWEARNAELVATGMAAAAFGELPRQDLFLLGGRGTIPGYDFRAFGGDRFATLNTVAAADLWRPWLRARVLAAAGYAGVGSAGEDALRRAGLETTDGLRGSAGVGVGLLHDIVRVDLARGFGDGGRWEVIVEARRAFWDFL